MWYQEGKITAVKNSSTIIGTGTEWVKGARAGEEFQGPDGRSYEIANIASDTALSIRPPYRGSDIEQGSYVIIPIQGYTKILADRAAKILDDVDESIADANQSVGKAKTQADRSELNADESKAARDVVVAAKAEALVAEAGAVAARDAAVAVTTGGTATIVPEAGKIPLARGDGKIDGAWVDFDTPSLDKIIESKIQARGVGSSGAVGVALIEVGGNGGTFVHINEYNQVIDVTTDQFNKHEIWGQIKDVVIDGQDMVRIPKFYIKTVWTYIAGYEGLKRVWLISLERGAGFRAHPAFMKNGAELDQIYVGKYQASMEGEKLASVPGVLPAVSRSLTQFTNDALARNVAGVDGFMLWSVYHWSAIQMLFLVEHKTMDSQAAVGQGRVGASSAAEVDATDVAQATYRGIVGLWGNVWQLMDGLRVSAGNVQVWDTEGNQTLVDTGHKRTAGETGFIYPIDFMTQSGDSFDLSCLFIGDSGPASNSGATATDNQYMDMVNTHRVARVGDQFSSGSRAGLWALYVSYSESATNASPGARLAKVDAKQIAEEEE